MAELDEEPVSCRICGAKAAVHVGTVEFHVGYHWPIWDCRACGCRFTRHENAVYDLLHSEAASCYTRYRTLQDQCGRYFEAGDLAGLRSLLSEWPKYGMVVEEVDRLPPDARMLEIGCARGYLTAYAILAGRNVLGVDVSQVALDAANATFGPHFVPPDSPRIQAGAPYDLIYHVGTIGCVADPVGMTRDLVALLKPGGVLVFNCPNVDGLCLPGQLWMDSAPPPDVVTLFRKGFWTRQLQDTGAVEERAEAWPPERNVVIGLRRLLRRRWRPPVPLPLRNIETPVQAPPSLLGHAYSLVERTVAKALRVTHLSRLAPEFPQEFGLMVRLTRTATAPSDSRETQSQSAHETATCVS